MKNLKHMNNIEQLGPQVAGIGIVDKQNGGSGQFAQVEVVIRPLDNSDAPNRVANAVVGGTIPTEFIASVFDGINDGLMRGPLGGYPVTGVAITIMGGKSHVKDSNSQAFREAGRLALQDALKKSDTTLLEPIANLDVTTPAEFLGGVIGDINRRRGQIMDMTTGANGDSTVRATIPLAETFGYATDLRSMTQGRGSFQLEPQGYATVPPSVSQAVLEK